MRIDTVDRAIDHAVFQAVEATIEQAVQVARERSSGPFSLSQLAKKDFPYAKRHGSPLLPPDMINAQSGEFRDAWTGRMTGARTGEIRNDAPHADFLQFGTKHMFRRPIKEAVEAEAEQILTTELAESFSRLE